ncbi:hypothetical protein DL93DRAFT_2162075 [Clavulina sp. PMI_390]|nr:hypothetical protein DL93DRAFT_2162075 [Clavulina sp. PMI_390]
MPNSLSLPHGLLASDSGSHNANAIELPFVTKKHTALLALMARCTGLLNDRNAIRIHFPLHTATVCDEISLSSMSCTSDPSTTPSISPCMAPGSPSSRESISSNIERDNGFSIEPLRDTDANHGLVTLLDSQLACINRPVQCDELHNMDHGLFIAPSDLMEEDWRLNCTPILTTAPLVATPSVHFVEPVTTSFDTSEQRLPPLPIDCIEDFLASQALISSWMAEFEALNPVSSTSSSTSDAGPWRKEPLDFQWHNTFKWRSFSTSTARVPPFRPSNRLKNVAGMTWKVPKRNADSNLGRSHPSKGLNMGVLWTKVCALLS